MRSTEWIWRLRTIVIDKKDKEIRYDIRSILEGTYFKDVTKVKITSIFGFKSSKHLSSNVTSL